jgi:hypothetical protein
MPRGRRLPALLGAAAATAIAVTLAAPESGTAQLPTTCRGAVCNASLSVDTAPVTWQSPETFYPNNERVFASPVSGLRPLTLRRSFGPGQCKHRFRGAGMSVVLKACGSQTPLRVRAFRLKLGSSSLRISYTAQMMLDDSTSSPPAGSSGAMTPISARR